jgi:hypothetical protein
MSSILRARNLTSHKAILLIASRFLHPVGSVRKAVLAAIALSSLLSVQVLAQSGSENSNQFGQRGQGGATYTNGALPPAVSAFQAYSVAVGPNACVPTSTANGLSYLENYAVTNLSLPNPFSTSPNSFAQVDNLAQRQQTFNLTKTDGTPQQNYSNLGGTYTTYMFNGTRTWLSANNPAANVSLSGQVAAGTPASWIQGAYAANTNVANAIPTAAYLAGLLNAQNNAVELTIEWGSYDVNNVWTASGGGHEVALTSINMGTSSIGFWDPWGNGGTNPDTSAFLYEGAVFGANVTTVGGYLYVTYPTVLADSDRQPNEYAVGAAAATGRIDVAMVETIVPEPAACLLYLIGTTLIVSFGRRARHWEKRAGHCPLR